MQRSSEEHDEADRKMHRLAVFEWWASGVPVVVGCILGVLALRNGLQVTDAGAYNTTMVQILPVLLVAVVVEAQGFLVPGELARALGPGNTDPRFELGYTWYLRLLPLVTLAAAECRVVYLISGDRSGTNEPLVTIALGMSLAALVMASIRRAVRASP